MLHLVNRERVGNHFRNLEEGALHDCVGSGTQSQLLSDCSCIDNIESDLVLSKILLHMIRQLRQRLLCIPD